MRITSQNNIQYSIKKPKEQAFKGYFACPIKEVHFQTSNFMNPKGVYEELSKKCLKFFNILVQDSDGIKEPSDLVYKNFLWNKNTVKNPLKNRWGQDNKVFLSETELGIFRGHRANGLADKFAKHLRLDVVEINTPIIGGNCFLGFNNNGKKFALLGEDALYLTTKYRISEQLNIHPKNIFIIPQPDFHIDMAIRPLNYPYVLVGDPELSLDLLKKSSNISHKKLKKVKASIDMRLAENIENNYASVKTTINNLEQNGFVPIRVPGLGGESELNYMNAIVHQDTDGKLVYITNKSSSNLELEQIFRQHLKDNVPQIKEVVFIEADDYLSQSLKVDGGGLHCLVCERPDFEKWNAQLKSVK